MVGISSKPELNGCTRPHALTPSRLRALAPSPLRSPFSALLLAPPPRRLPPLHSPHHAPASGRREATVVRFDSKLGRWRVRTDAGANLALLRGNLERVGGSSSGGGGGSSSSGGGSSSTSGGGGSSSSTRKREASLREEATREEAAET